MTPRCPGCGADFATTAGSSVERRPDGNATCGACRQTSPWRDWQPVPASVIDSDLARAAALRRDQIDVLQACRCLYPLVKCRNMAGHPETCPAYAVWERASRNRSRDQ